MGHFQENMQHLFRRSRCHTEEEFGEKVGLKRWTINKLKRGVREPTPYQLDLIADYFGIEPDDLFLPPKKFRALCKGKIHGSNFLLHSLRVTERNMRQCEDVKCKYNGQYTVYTAGDSNEYVIASALEILDVTKNGIEFKMINPYIEDGQPDAFIYRGYIMPVEEYLYFIGEQESNTYEILIMIFHRSGAPNPTVLRGLLSGVGVKNGVKSIASVPAIAQRQNEEIGDWKEQIGNKIGYFSLSSLPEMIRRQLDNYIVKIEQ